jgi:hypothetical protein
MDFFDDSRLENPDALAAADAELRQLAQAGARIRIEAEAAETALARVEAEPRPRAVVAIGADARLLRAVLEPVCPMPFVAWPRHGLPGWAGALDLVVVLARDGADPDVIATVGEAARRGSQLIVACPQPSAIAEHVTGRDAVLLPTRTGDTLASAVVMLTALHRMQLGPDVAPELVATALDRIAEDCSPHVDVSDNPGKELALGLADAQPLVWGGSVLASRASRRIAEALRVASGRPALAAHSSQLIPMVDAALPRNLFDDPFEDPQPTGRRPGLVVLDDGTGDELTNAAQNQLHDLADRRDVRICAIDRMTGSDLERYAGLLQTGLYGAAYLSIGLGRYVDN